MNSLSRIAICIVLAACAGAQAVAGDVFALPSNAAATNVPVFRDDLSQSLTPVPTNAAAVAVLAKPNGSKFYVVTASATGTVKILDGSLALVRAIDLGAAAQAAAISPDGTRLLVLAGTLHLFDITTTDDTDITPSVAPSVGTNPVLLAFSQDSKHAYIVSNDASRLTPFNLSTNLADLYTSTPGGVTSLTVSPAGLIYLSSPNALLEVDPFSGSQRNIPLNGLPGKPAFTPDGNYALLPNDPRFIGTGLGFLVDLNARTLVAAIAKTGISPEPVLTQMVALDNSTFLAVNTATQQLVKFVINPADPVNPITMSNSGFLLSATAGVRALAVSKELPQPSSVYVASNTTISRGVLATSAIQTLGLGLAPAALQLAGASSTAAPVGSQQFNDLQTVVGGSTTKPLILRLWDSSGLPVYGKTVQFSAAADGVTFETPTDTTSVDGYALTRVTVPKTPGPIQISAAVQGMTAPVAFTITVAGQTNGGTIGGFQMDSGNGQIVPAARLSDTPLTVRLTDSAGNPLSGATVSWTLGGHGYLAGATSPTDPNVFVSSTDANGYAEMYFRSPLSMVSPVASFDTATVTASVPGFSDVTFVETIIPLIPSGTSPAYPIVSLLTPPPSLGIPSITGQAGQTLTAAIVATITAITGMGTGSGIPNVGLTIVSDLDPTTSPSAFCLAPGKTALSGDTGQVSCDLRLGGIVGGPVRAMVVIGGTSVYGQYLDITVTPGVPGLVKILQGNNQSGQRGATLPTRLLAQVSDAAGNLLPNIPVTWEAVVPGTVSLTGANTMTDALGNVSATATLGSTPGPVQVRVRAGSVQALFTLTVNLSFGSITTIDGDSQTAFQGQQFAKSLVVEVRDSTGALVPGTTVTFAVASGSATLGASAPQTGNNGRASTTVTAGQTIGPVVVTATVPGFSATFNLAVVPPGPVVLLQNIRSAISGDAGVSPGGIIAIYGDGIAPNIQGSVIANGGFLLGPLPTSLAGVQVLFGTTPAPIYHVDNISGQQFVVVQAPFTLTGGTQVSVTINANGGSTKVAGVPVKTYQPGIFESLGPQGQRWAVLTKDDGSYVTTDNPVLRGVDLHLHMYCAGLGQATPALGTNYVGIAGQTVAAPMVVAVNNAGVRIVSAKTMEGVVGVYVLTFEVPADTTPGLDRSLAIATANADGSPSPLRYYSAIPSIQ